MLPGPCTVWRDKWDIVVVQVYMPTTNHDEIEKLYEEINDIFCKYKCICQQQIMMKYKNCMKRSVRYCVSTSIYANNKSWWNRKTIWRDQWDIVVVQVYMPTTNHDKMEKLYEEMNAILC